MPPEVRQDTVVPTEALERPDRPLHTDAAERTVRLGSLRVRIRLRGYGDRPPLILLNGLGAPLELWDPLLEWLGGRTIAFDAPGSGRSDTPRMPVSIAGHARLAIRLLDHLGEGQVDVLGLSFGGLVAQELARLAPTRVERLVLSSTSCGWGAVPGSPAALMAVVTPQRYYSPALFRTVAPQYIGGVESESRDFLRRQVRTRYANPPSATGYLHQVWAAATWSSMCWLREVRQPTLVLAGERDPLVPPANAGLLAALLPSARSHIVPEGGHLCLLDRAGSLAPMIEGFLSRPETAEERK